MLRWLERLLTCYPFRPQANGKPRAKRTILVVSTLSCEYNTWRVLALLEGWRLIIAPTLDRALEWRRQVPVGVVLYDQDLPGIEWQQGVVALLKNFPPACLILLSSLVEEKLRLPLLRQGGCDLARRPIEEDAVVRLVNGCFLLMSEIDSSWLPQAQHPPNSRALTPTGPFSVRAES